MERFYTILWEENPLYRMYVYWFSGGKIIKPAILKNVTPFEDLETYLRGEFGEQEYYVMILYRKKMVLTGIISIGVPLVFTPKNDIRLEIEFLREDELKRKRKRSRKRL